MLRIPVLARCGEQLAMWLDSIKSVKYSKQIAFWKMCEPGRVWPLDPREMAVPHRLQPAHDLRLLLQQEHRRLLHQNLMAENCIASNVKTTRSLAVLVVARCYVINLQHVLFYCQLMCLSIKAARACDSSRAEKGCPGLSCRFKKSRPFFLQGRERPTGLLLQGRPGRDRPPGFLLQGPIQVLSGARPGPVQQTSKCELSK